MEIATTRATAVIATIAMSLAACSGGNGAGAAGAQPASGGPTAPVAASPSAGSADGGLCQTYNATDIGRRLGVAVHDGSAAGPGGTACQWDAIDDDAFVQIQVIQDVDDWETPDLGDGYETLSDIGREAFVLPELGGWKAGALTDTAVVYVAMVGGDADRTRSVDLLRDLLGHV